MSLSQPAAHQAPDQPGDHARRRIVAEVMTPGVVTAHLDAPVKEIAAAMVRNRIGAVPVIDAQRAVVGVVTATDLLRHLLAQRRRSLPAGRNATAEAVMSRHPVTVHPQMTIVDAARLAAARHLHFLPVVADGVLAGCVTGSDLAKVYVRPDDEIRAEIVRVLPEQVSEPDTVGIEVTEGVVTAIGPLASRAEAAHLLERLEAVPGVVEVRSRFTYREDLGY